MKCFTEVPPGVQQQQDQAVNISSSEPDLDKQQQQQQNNPILNESLSWGFFLGWNGPLGLSDVGSKIMDLNVWDLISTSWNIYDFRLWQDKAAAQHGLWYQKSS